MSRTPEQKLFDLQELNGELYRRIAQLNDDLARIHNGIATLADEGYQLARFHGDKTSTLPLDIDTFLATCRVCGYTLPGQHQADCTTEETP